MGSRTGGGKIFLGSLSEMSEDLLIGWTTLGSEVAAEQLARGLVAADLAACVQVEGEVISYYK